MATKAKESIITKVELDSTGTNYIISTADNDKLPWLPIAYMQNWLIKNDMATYKPRQALRNSVVTWEEKSVKKGEPALDRKGEQVIDKVTKNPVFYTKDHVRVENLVLYPSEIITEKEDDGAVKLAIEEQKANLSASDKIKQALAAKKAARAAAAKAAEVGSTTGSEGTGNTVDETYTEPILTEGVGVDNEPPF